MKLSIIVGVMHIFDIQEFNYHLIEVIKLIVIESVVA